MTMRNGDSVWDLGIQKKKSFIGNTVYVACQSKVFSCLLHNVYKDEKVSTEKDLGSFCIVSREEGLKNNFSVPSQMVFATREEAEDSILK